MVELDNSWNKLFNSFMPFIATIHKSEQEKRALILSKIDEYG